MGRRSDHSRDELYELVLEAAQGLAEKEGLHGINARRIAAAIGYSVGTLYNHFANLDDLIVHLNARTLDALYEACAEVPRDDEPEVVLRALARRYIAFVSDHPRLWSVVIEHSLPGAGSPAWLEAKVMRLLGLAERALAPLFAPGREAERHRSALVLWSALYGICALGSADKLGPTDTMPGLVDTLVKSYLAGLRSEGTAPETVRRRA